MQERDERGPPASGRRDDAAYTLARLVTRRPVRAALALSALRGGVAKARQVWSAPASVDAPTHIERRLPYPELRIAHTGTGAVAATSAPTEQLTEADWRVRLAHVRPDLVLLDGADRLADPRQLREVVDEARRLDLPVAAVGCGIELARRAGVLDGLVASLAHPGEAADQDVPRLDPWVDVRHANPVGVDHAPTGRSQLDTDAPLEEQLRRARASAVVTAPVGAADEFHHARSVLHVLASGVPCVAERTHLLERLLRPHDDLLIADGELDDAAEALLADEDERERASVRVRRHVLTHHTSTTAFERVLEASGLDRKPAPTISVLLATRRPHLVAEALAAIDRQDHPNVEIQLLLHGVTDEVPERAVSSHRTLDVHRVPRDRPLGAVLNVGLDAARGRFIAKMDDDDLYGPTHLRDLLLALTYSGADAAGRWSNVVYLADRDRTVHQHVERQERWAHHLPGCTLLVHGDMMRALRWRLVPRGVDTELVRAIHGAGGRCYGTHRFGFIRQRHGDHTFDRSDAAFEAEGRSQPGLDRSVLAV